MPGKLPDDWTTKLAFMRENAVVRASWDATTGALTSAEVDPTALSPSDANRAASTTQQSTTTEDAAKRRLHTLTGASSRLAGSTLVG